MSDILDRIDAATDNLCGCGCKQPLDPNGPSGYFINAEHQALWDRYQVTGEDLVPAVLGDMWRGFQVHAETMRRMMSGVAECIELMRDAAAQAARDIGHLHVFATPPEPTHPMQAVIEARRNRNTGPHQQARAPRSINPRRSR